MKKILALLISVMIALSSVVSVYSAELLGQGYLFEDGTTVYLFGELSENEEFDEVGVKIGEEYYSLDDSRNYQAKTQRKFGIGLKDSKTLLGIEFDAAPYVVAGDETVVGEAKHISRNPQSAISEITVGGKPVSNFHAESTETDFYYGMDSLPETAEELPTVSVKAGSTAYDVAVAPEVGGFVATASYNGTEAARVHFREFAEVTEEVPLKHMYRVHNTYVHFADEYDSEAPYVAASSNNTVKNKADLRSDNDSQLIYAHFEIPEVEGYAAVGYSYEAAIGVLNPGNNVLLYNYCGDLSDFVTPERASAEKFWVPKDGVPHFVSFKGLNESEAYKVASLEVTAEKTKHIVESDYISEKNMVVIFKNENNDITKASYILYKATEYPNTMTVKYVEKNPADLTDSDASIKSISVNGTALEFDEKITDYYYGVDAGTIDNVTEEMVSAVATQSEKTTVEIGKFAEERDGKVLTVQATAKDGTTGEIYKLHIREYQTKTIEYSDARNVLRGNMKTLETPTDSQMKKLNSFYLWQCSCETSIVSDTTHSNRSVGYVLYDISDDSEVAGIRSIKVNASPIKYRIAASDVKVTIRSTLLTDDNIGNLVTDGKLTYVSGETGLTKSRFGYTESEDSVLGVMDINASSYTTVETYLDATKVPLYTGNQLLFTVSKNYDTETATNGNTYYAVPSIEVEYIIKESPDMSDSDASLAAIGVNGEAIEFDPEVMEYYCGIEAGTLASFTSENVTGVPVQTEKATVEVSEPADEENGKYVTVQATAKDGTKGEIYKLHIREYQTATISYSDARNVLRGNMKTLETPTDSQMKKLESFSLWQCSCETSIVSDTTHSNRSVGYVLYDISDEFEVAGIRSIKVNASPIKYRIAASDVKVTIRSTLLTDDNIGNLVTDGKLTYVSGETGLTKSRFGYTESEDSVVGVMDINASSYTTVETYLDATKVPLYTGNQLLFTVSKNYDTETATNGITYYAVPSIDVEYIVK